MRRITIIQQRGIVRAFAEGKPTRLLAMVWEVPVARIEAIIRKAMKEKP